jgi:hypothetical protein
MNPPEEVPFEKDGGLAFDSVSNPGTPNETTAKVILGGDKIKAVLPQNQNKIYDLINNQIYHIDNLKKTYYLSDLDICEQFGLLLNLYLPYFQQGLEMLGRIPLDQSIGNSLPAETKAKIKEAQAAAKKMSARFSLKPEDIKIDFTKKIGLVDGNLVEQVFLKDPNGEILQEIWLAKRIIPLGFMHRNKISQATRDRLFAGNFHSPAMRRAFSQLALKTTTFLSSTEVIDVKIIKNVKYRKIKPDEFKIPKGYKQLPRLDVKEFEELYKTLPLQNLLVP